MKVMKKKTSNLNNKKTLHLKDEKKTITETT